MNEAMGPEYAKGYKAGTKATAKEAMENIKDVARLAGDLHAQLITTQEELDTVIKGSLQILDQASAMLKEAMGPGYELETDLFKLIEKLPQRLAEEYYRGYNDTNGDGFE